MTLAPAITRQNLAFALGFSLSTIEKDLRLLRMDGIVKRTGSDKTGSWEIVSE